MQSKSFLQVHLHNVYVSVFVCLAGMGPIYLNEVQCTGHERSLWNCHFKNITDEDCKHTEDAAVRCNVPYMGFEKKVRDTFLLHMHTNLGYNNTTQS